MSYTITGFSERLRWAVCAAVLSALSVASTPAEAAGKATLVRPDICEDPSQVFDYEWTKAKYGSNTLFYMDAAGTVSAVTDGASAFDTYDTIYVAAHGGTATIGGSTYDNFISYFSAAHASVPKEVFFAVCGAGKGPDNLLKKISAKYGGNINKLIGGVASCALTGNGDKTLANAEYRIFVGNSDPVAYEEIIKNITAKWAGNFPGSTDSYETVCKARIVPFDRAKVKGFVDTVFVEFSKDPVSGKIEDSSNYHDLIKLNMDSRGMTVCGKDPDGAGVVACP